MRFIIFFLFCSISSPLISQFDSDSYAIKVLPAKSKDSYKATRSLNTIIRESFSENFVITHRSSFQIKPTINIGKAHLIEGMDIKATGEPQIEFHVTDKKTKEKDVFIFKQKVNASDNAKLTEALVDAFTLDIDAQQKLNDFINAFIDKVFKENCDKYIEAVEKLNAENDFHKSLEILINLNKSNCSPKAKTLMSKTLKAQSDYSCSEKIQKASVMINSGVTFQMKRAIPILLSISPNAPCANEAIELSKQIGSKVDKTSKISIELSKYQSSQRNYSDWEKYYLYQLMAEK